MSETDATMTDAEVDEVRRQFDELRRSDPKKYSWEAIERMSGMKRGTLTQWAVGTYTGRNDRIAADVQRWLRSVAEKARQQLQAPEPPRFVLTKSAEEFMAVMARCQHLPDFGIIAGNAGCGKTSAACEYKRRNPQVYKLTLQPMTPGPKALMDGLSELVGTPGFGNNNHRQAAAIIAKLRGTKGLIIVDEAQHMSSQALDQLRTIHDLAEIGVVLMGNLSIYQRIEGAGRDPAYAQLFSRVGVRVTKARTKVADAETLITAWRIEGEEERKLLKAIARQAGELRVMTKVLKLAHMLAAAEDRTEVALEDLKLAHEQLSEQAGPARAA